MLKDRDGGGNESSKTVHRNLERHLLSVTFIALMVYRVFCIIAAVMQENVDSEDQDEYVLLVGECVTNVS